MRSVPNFASQYPADQPRARGCSDAGQLIQLARLTPPEQRLATSFRNAAARVRDKRQPATIPRFQQAVSREETECTIARHTTLLDPLEQSRPHIRKPA